MEDVRSLRSQGYRSYRLSWTRRWNSRRKWRVIKISGASCLAVLGDELEKLLIEEDLLPDVSSF
jgi:hypothetical protein